jgi:hypothetical protein
VLDDHARRFRDVSGALHARASTTSREGVVLALILGITRDVPEGFRRRDDVRGVSRAAISTTLFVFHRLGVSAARLGARGRREGRRDGVSGRRRRARVKKVKKCKD